MGRSTETSAGGIWELLIFLNRSCTEEREENWHWTCSCHWLNWALLNLCVSTSAPGKLSRPILGISKEKMPAQPVSPNSGSFVCVSFAGNACTCEREIGGNVLATLNFSPLRIIYSMNGVWLFFCLCLSLHGSGLEWYELESCLLCPLVLQNCCHGLGDVAAFKFSLCSTLSLLLFLQACSALSLWFRGEVKPV